jgi:hypothetical protein
VALSYLQAKGSSIKLGGWHASGAITLPEHKWLGLIVDVSGHYLGGADSDDDPMPECTMPPCAQADRTELALMIGPRFTPIKEGHPLHMLFVHAMAFGMVQRSGGGKATGITSGAVAVGVGFDFPVTKNDTWIPRLQIDYIKPVSSDIGGGFRVSAGLVYRLDE